MLFNYLNEGGIPADLRSKGTSPSEVPRDLAQPPWKESAGAWRIPTTALPAAHDNDNGKTTDWKD